MISKLNLLVCLVFLLLMGNVKAQNNLKQDTFRVVKEYKPILIDADKITFEPEISDTFKLETKLDYTFIHKPQKVSFELEPIKPARIKGEPLVKLYNGYARLGVGNVMLPFGEVYYSNKRSKKFAAGAHVKYLKQAELNDYEGSDFSKAHFEVFGKRFWKTNTLETKLAYDIHSLNYYGFYQLPTVQQIELPTPELEQQYQQLNADFRLKSTVQDSFNLRHDIDAHFHHLTNSSGNAEQQFKASGNLSQFVNRELYELEVLADYNNYELSQSSAILALKPQISTHGKNFRVKAGLSIYMNVADQTDFHFYPLAEVKYNVIEDILVPYAGIEGKIERLNYQSIIRENPFVAENIQLQNSNQEYNIYGGMRGTLSSDLSFNTSVARIRTSSDYFYLKSPIGNEILGKDFNLTYDRLDEWQVKGEFIYRMGEKIKLFVLGEYFQFETEQEAEAWHRPDVKVSLSGEYNLRHKLIARASVFYWGEQYAQGVSAITINQFNQITDRTFKVETLDPIVDLNLGFEYRYTKKLSAFINFNNLAGINYQKYQDYPLQGFNVWGGLTYGF
ncbi:MAG: hypothetical protein RIC95_04765 [Vicingaceae bacterium]